MSKTLRQVLLNHTRRATLIDTGVPLASDLQPAVHTSPQRLLIVTPDGTFMCPEHTVYFLESGAPGEEPLVSLTASTIPLTYAKMM